MCICLYVHECADELVGMHTIVHVYEAREAGSLLHKTPRQP